MSINALEKAMWQAYVNHADTERFKTDPEGYVAGFDLDENERNLLLAHDVAGQIAYGANPLLVMMVWQAVNGMAEFYKYFEIVNGPAASATQPA